MPERVQPVATAAKWIVTLWMLAVVIAMFLWVPEYEGLAILAEL